MFLLKSVTLMGLGPFKNTFELDISSDRLVIIGENNVGKSTILKSIDFFFNENQHSTVLKSIDMNNDQAFIELKLQCDGREVSCRKNLRKTSTKITVKNCECSPEDITGLVMDGILNTTAIYYSDERLFTLKDEEFSILKNLVYKQTFEKVEDKIYELEDQIDDAIEEYGLGIEEQLGISINQKFMWDKLIKFNLVHKAIDFEALSISTRKIIIFNLIMKLYNLRDRDNRIFLIDNVDNYLSKNTINRFFKMLMCLEGQNFITISVCSSKEWAQQYEKEQVKYIIQNKNEKQLTSEEKNIYYNELTSKIS